MGSRNVIIMAHPLWTDQVFRGRVDCDKFRREGWGPVELTIEITGIRSKTEFVALTNLSDPEAKVRSKSVWMEADGMFDPRRSEVILMETQLHDASDAHVVTPFAWRGILDGIRLRGDFKASGAQGIEYGATSLNMMCVSGGAKTHILAGSAAMDEVKSRIGGLANALEAESWERRRMRASASRRVNLGLASRRADQIFKVRQAGETIRSAADQNMAASQSVAAANLKAIRHSFVRASMESSANRF